MSRQETPDPSSLDHHDLERQPGALTAAEGASDLGPGMDRP